MRSLSPNWFFGTTLHRNEGGVKINFYGPVKIIPIQEHRISNSLQPCKLSSEESFNLTLSRDM